MAKTNDVVVMKEKLARLNERAKSAEEELKRLEEKRKKVQNLIAEEERKKRTHNLFRRCGERAGFQQKQRAESLLTFGLKEDFLKIKNKQRTNGVSGEYAKPANPVYKRIGVVG